MATLLRYTFDPSNADDQVCPVMSRPVLAGDDPREWYLAQVRCIKTDCAMWRDGSMFRGCGLVPEKVMAL